MHLKAWFNLSLKIIGYQTTLLVSTTSANAKMLLISISGLEFQVDPKMNGYECDLL